MKRISVESLVKRYGSVVALQRASVDMEAGSITALLGQNGSGKSTVVKILSGDIRADAGSVKIDGTPVHFHGTADSIAAGISVAYQELSLIPHLTVAQNLLLGLEPMTAVRTVDRRRLVRLAAELWERWGVPTAVDYSATVGTLSLSDRQLIEVTKALARQPKLLILDEASASLTANGLRWLMDVSRQTARDGGAVVFISHRLKEAFDLADRCVVMRDGEDVLTKDIASCSEDEIIAAMVGEARDRARRTVVRNSGDILLLAEDVVVSSSAPPAGLSLHTGEVLGIGGLQGQGQIPLLKAIAGEGLKATTLVLRGHRMLIGSARHALSAGIVYVPEDRRTEGLFLNMSIKENLFAGSHRRRTGAAGWRWTGSRTEAKAARTVVSTHSIRSESVEEEVEWLSGGNQQKVLFARAIATKPVVILLADVTRGVDVQTKEEIYGLIAERASEGVSIIMYSSEIPELVRLCERVLVMHDSSIVAELTGEALTEENIVRASLGLDVTAVGGP
jgi:ABC-type sugar transport system ATPase subunit